MATTKPTQDAQALSDDERVLLCKTQLTGVLNAANLPLAVLALLLENLLAQTNTLLLQQTTAKQAERAKAEAKADPNKKGA